MNRTAKNFTPQEICDRVEEAMKRASTYFPARTDLLGGKWEQYADAANVDKDLAALSPYSLEYRVNIHKAFNLGYSMSFNIVARTHDNLVCKCEITWASGGGDPATAVAAASLHLEAAQKAAQCQMAATDAFGAGMRIVDDEDREAFRAGTKLFYAMVEAAQDAISAEHEKAQAA